ncbi:hypothetical protein OSB04_006333 [Centaurea solstitialis]|uniref:Rab-GAP TBC domain-containing protein n=1 Tax=Centaurea solstitialis TaxID=347529 RepID=A0AA38U2B6_9ASTR|nr:hypothetical protein OSB04_006333 [Centaurea solstitialis]
MYGTQSKRDLSFEIQSQMTILRPSIHARRANIVVKFQDLYGFTVEGNVDDVNILNEVREKVRQQGKVWWSLEANKAKKKSTVPDSYYRDLTVAVEGKVTPATKQIDHDLPRTFPGHPWLDTPDGHAALRRVLVVYSFRDSDVGYCQGLNYVAALLLLVMKTEEEAFWMLAVLLENVLVNNCYTTNLSGCHVEQRVFKGLLDKECPRVSTHLEALEFDVSLVATEWFLCLFSKSLPSETTMRVWDVLFYEGAKVLFNVALAIFKVIICCLLILLLLNTSVVRDLSQVSSLQMKELELLTTHHIGDVLNIIHNTTHHLFDPDELLTVAFDKISFMTTTNITRQRKKQEPAVMAELGQRLRRLNSTNMDVNTRLP